MMDWANSHWESDYIFRFKVIEYKGHRIHAEYRIGMVEGSTVWEVELDGESVDRGDVYGVVADVEAKIAQVVTEVVAKIDAG